MMSGKAKILVTDSDSIERQALGLMLSALGYEIQNADDGNDVILKLQDEVPDLLVLDMVLPKLSGWEVLKKIKQDARFKDIPVISLSEIDDIKEEVNAFALGVEDYIRKPLKFSVVIARINRRLNAKKS
jgi:PleD family two-component response regulator